MTTALDLVKTAMKKIRVLGVDREPTAAEAADGLSSLNSMLDAWAIERLMVYQIIQQSLSWSAGFSSRTIGSGGNFSVTRPDRIDSAFVRDNYTQDYPMIKLDDRTDYDRIVKKTSQSSLPRYIFYDHAYPIGTLYVYPQPSANVTILLNTWQTLQSFATLTTAISLPHGYQRAIEFNLPGEIASDYGMDVPPAVLKVARESKAAIKGLNTPTMVAQLDSAVATAGRGRGLRRHNIYTDGQ